MKDVIGADFSALTPGVMSTRTRERTSSGAWRASAIAAQATEGHADDPERIGGELGDDPGQIGPVRRNRQRPVRAPV